MKVFVLMYYNYDDTDFYGVFETKEKAQTAADKLSEEGKRVVKHLFSGEDIIYYVHPHKYFSISEHEVQ